jgi:ubiquinol-cytochrome c reductase cytochrome c1 subunit
MLTFYPDDTTASGWNNLVFPNAAMPHAMWELQGIQVKSDRHAIEEGQADAGHADITAGFDLVEAGLQTPEEYRQTVKDLVTFMVYLSEPAQLKRAAIGPWAILFLVIFSLIAWMLKKEYWRDVH